MPFWQPRGMIVWNVLEDLRRRENRRRGYHEVRTPQLYDADLWKTSGHWEKYRDHMFSLDVEGRPFGLKPMNCPGHCVVYRPTAAQLPRPAVPARRGREPPPERAVGRAPRSPARAPLRPGRRPHLLHARPDRGRGPGLPRLRVHAVPAVRPRHRCRALDTSGQQARQRTPSGIRRRPPSAGRSNATGSTTR